MDYTWIVHGSSVDYLQIIRRISVQGSMFLFVELLRQGPLCLIATFFLSSSFGVHIYIHIYIYIYIYLPMYPERLKSISIYGGLELGMPGYILGFSDGPQSL